MHYRPGKKFAKNAPVFFAIFQSITYYINNEIPPTQFFAMDTLKRFYRNVLQNRLAFVSGTNEDRIHSLELESHLVTAKYHNFTLTEAIRPSLDLTIIPQQGYKYDRLKLQQEIKCNARSGKMPIQRANARWLMPILVISVSLEGLFDTFLDLLDPLGNSVNVVLETSHRYAGAYRTELHREHIDLPVLKSFLYEHEDLLLNDGCTGIAVLAPKIQAEVRLDEHKLIYVRAKSLSAFEKVLHRHHISLNEAMPLITEAEHVHITRDEHFQRFQTLQMSLGMDESYMAAR